MVLGIKSDEKFGPLLLAGLGGIHVEVLKDVVLAPVPVSRKRAGELLGRLKGAKMLEGVRDDDPRDVEAFVETMVALSSFAADFADDIAEIDLNPVIVHREGEGVSIVDALIVKQD